MAPPQLSLWFQQRFSGLRIFCYGDHVQPTRADSLIEGGTNLFELKYFDRVAYLAQSPQFYKEHGVAGFELSTIHYPLPTAHLP
jgi:nondiscriminating aspartyl-tRNA synthetase